jgi:hypothetical protein
MASRMERYYNGEERSQKNKKLYDEISANGNYTNIEGVVDISNSNEINIENIKELINGSYNTKHSKVSTPVENKINRVELKRNVEERNYDIMDALNKAKTNHSEKDAKYRNLKKRQIKILKELKDEHPEDEKIDELMNTLALGDDLGIFDDLKSNTMVGEEAAAIKKVLDEAKESEKEDDSDDNFIEEVKEDNKIDKSFYTSSIIISDEDLEDFKNLDKNLKKNNKLMKTLIIVFSCLIAVILLCIIGKVLFF